MNFVVGIYPGLMCLMCARYILYIHGKVRLIFNINAPPGSIEIHRCDVVRAMLAHRGSHLAAMHTGMRIL